VLPFLPALAAGYTEFGRLALLLSVGSAFVVGFLVALVPMPRVVRVVALVAGPLADFGVFSFFIWQNGPCVGECYDQVALGLFAVLAFVAWLVGAGSGYLVRKAVSSSRPPVSRRRRTVL
jgi:hypothetical protein